MSINTAVGIKAASYSEQCKPLRLYPPGMERPRFCRPGKHRERARIPGHVRQAISECAAGASPWPLLLYGPVGTGKTCAAICVCDAVVGSFAFYGANDLAVLIFQATYAGLHRDDGVSRRAPRVYPHEIWSGWEMATVAVLDDLGTAERKNVGHTHYETVKKAIESRDGAPLILTANVTPGELATIYDDRVASRAASGTVVRVDGHDRRIENDAPGRPDWWDR